MFPCYNRTMNPLLMTAVRNAKIQTSITRDHDLDSAETDSFGFPLSIIHDIKVVVETFRLLIRDDWEYSTDQQQKVHWNESRIAEMSPSNHFNSTSGEEPSPVGNLIVDQSASGQPSNGSISTTRPV